MRAYEILKDFQPLLATTVALLAAALAYRTAMVKVKQDRELHDRDLERQRLGIVLRLRFAVIVMANDARRFAANANALTELWPSDTPRQLLVVADWNFQTAAAIDEAWAKLDVFPTQVSEQVSQLKVELFRFQMAKGRLADLPGAALEWRTKEGAEVAIRQSSERIANIARELRSELEKEP